MKIHFKKNYSNFYGNSVNCERIIYHFPEFAPHRSTGEMNRRQEKVSRKENAKNKAKQTPIPSILKGVRSLDEEKKNYEVNVKTQALRIDLR
jgi:hypothetical protein